MNFKNVITKVKNFVINFKNPIIAVGCILIVAAVVLTISLVAVKTGDAESSTCEELLVTEEDYSVEEIESVTTYEETTYEETTTEKTVAVVTTRAEIYSDQSEDWLNGYSYYEYDLLARTIYQESGICGEYCQWLVGSTVLNLADRRGGIENVVFDYNTFNVAYILFDATPSDLSYAVARRLISGDRDYKVMAFRDSYYHDFGTPYASVDNMYFSVY